MLASLLGLSIALGAFTAGLFVSSSYYTVSYTHLVRETQ